MNYFYQPLLDNSVSQFSFTPEESRHIVRVLRRKKGDTLYVTNGKGYLFTTEILEADMGRCVAKIAATRKMPPGMYQLHLAVAPTKKLDRFEWFLEKATEIGVDRITPIQCERSERVKLPMDRLNRVVQEAMKQSLRTYLPRLDKLTPLADILEEDTSGLRFIAHCEEEEKMELKRRVAPDKDVLVLIGPEGDFSKTEIQQAADSGFLPVSLGQSRLRTETAALVACTTVNLINNG